jgi:hypothetical protein
MQWFGLAIAAGYIILVKEFDLSWLGIAILFACLILAIYIYGLYEDWSKDGKEHRKAHEKIIRYAVKLHGYSDDRKLYGPFEDQHEAMYWGQGAVDELREVFGTKNIHYTYEPIELHSVGLFRP